MAELRSTPVRCAIYTRKSTLRGLDNDFNTLQSQREVCSAYVRSQAHRNWCEVPQQYDDGGFTGGNLERPALRCLLDDIQAGRVDLVVVYKIDRLSRSLADFIRLIETLEQYGVGFVSVTQTFDTSDSMGRLVLNILLTFAQFERELASDRARDKKAALMRRGLFVGGTPPFGYVLGNRGVLELDPYRADVVREIFERFPETTAQQLARELTGRGCRSARYKTKGGKERGGWPLYTGRILKMLSNPIYTGHIVYRGDWIEAAFEPLVTREQFDLVQEIKRERFPKRHDPVRNCLLGILYDEQGRRMRIQAGTGKSKHIRYYKSAHATWAREGKSRRVMVHAERVERLAVSTVQALLRDRVKLKAAVLSVGLYSEEIRKALKQGPRAANRMDSMPPEGLRSMLLALVPRAEVREEGLKLLVSCDELLRLLAWDGVGTFSRGLAQSKRAQERVHEVDAPAFIICGHPRFAIPVDPCPMDAEGEKRPWLIETLRKSAEARDLMLTNRHKTMSELAKEANLGPSTFARYLRLNYLAPDIQAAIMDGRQPTKLTNYDLLYSAMPLDWAQQRAILGFDAM
jgi:DNA invertase Pin-like site-specific DNA recombinase